MLRALVLLRAPHRSMQRQKTLLDAVQLFLQQPDSFSLPAQLLTAPGQKHQPCCACVVSMRKYCSVMQLLVMYVLYYLSGCIV